MTIEEDEKKNYKRNPKWWKVKKEKIKNYIKPNEKPHKKCVMIKKKNYKNKN